MKKFVKKATILLLKARYKDNDDEELGAFLSMDVLLRFFARTIMPNHKGEALDKIAEIVALRTAELCGKGENGECVDGNTRYWIHEIAVSVEDDVPDCDEKDKKKGKAK